MRNHPGSCGQLILQLLSYFCKKRKFAEEAMKKGKSKESI